jgi:outer membrane protein TolC
MEKFKIKLTLVLVLFLGIAPNSYCQTSNLSDGPQTLEPVADEIKTEVVPDTQPADSVEASAATEEPITEEKTPPTEKKKTNVVLSEEDLLKPKEKKETNKVKSQKISESEIYISESDKYKVESKFKSLKLNDVIEQGLRKNYDEGLRQKKEVYSDLVFEGTTNKFWYPNIKLVLSTDSQLISLLGSSSRKIGTNNPKVPTGKFGLSLGDYTVFNWGKDYALYLNSKSTYEREKAANLEARQQLKLDLIYNFFNLVTTKNIEKIYQDQLRQVSFVYRLNKEKLTIGKTSQQDYYQSRSEYLKAQSDFHQAKMDTDVADENMSYLIADEVGTKYVLIEGLDFKRLKISLNDSLSQAESKNPTLLNNKTTLINAERSYDIAEKENLPLPKFSVNLGAYDKKFGPATNRTNYETVSGNGNVELVASISATWDLVGDNGYLNSTKLAKSRVTREIANYELDKNKHYTSSKVRETYKNILSYQNQMLILEARLPSVQKSFDTVLENYLSAKSKYNDYHLALIDLVTTKILLERVKLNHLIEKLNLAKLMGTDDFPGENFEHLAVKVKGK